MSNIHFYICERNILMQNIIIPFTLCLRLSCYIFLNVKTHDTVLMVPGGFRGLFDFVGLLSIIEKTINLP